MRRVAAYCMLGSVSLCASAYAQTNTTTRVSVSSSGAQGAGGGFNATLSGNGRYVAFDSGSTNLVADDTNATTDIFVYDREMGTTERVNLGPIWAQATGGSSFSPSISTDGRYVLFSSEATNLVPGDTNGLRDIFVHDRNLNVTTRVHVTTDGFQVRGGAGAYTGVLSATGRYAVFESEATNLVTGDTNGTLDIFRHDRNTTTTIRVSVTNAEAQANAEAIAPSVSADGRYVAFQSAATNLVAGDTNGQEDIFVRDILGGTTTRVSVGPSGLQPNGRSIDPSISADGRYVVFETRATNLIPNGRGGLYVHDRTTGVTSALSLDPASSRVMEDPTISGNGRYVCFTAGPDLVPSEVFVIDRQTLAKTRVSVSTTGEVGGHSNDCSISDDGTIVAFVSLAANLVPGDTNGAYDAFARTNVATMALEKSTVAFAAVSNGTTFVSQTPAHTVRLMQSGTGTVAWAVASSQPWLQVSPPSGTGSATLTLTVVPAAGLPAGGTVTGSIFVSLIGSLNTLTPIAVTLTLVPNGTSVIPFGTVDTPTDLRTGVTGAVPFTGWALDDIGVARVSICRAAFGAEVAPIDPNCGGAAEVFVGFAVFIDGARPDVAAGFPAYPRSTRAGWGFMVLTNMLPSQGNGTYVFTMRAQDYEGHWSVLGTRTMTCANASATLPFGTLDTPEQGGVASGAYVNFGWALTPLPKTIPTNGVTMRVLVDGVDIGWVDYNHARPDIQALFPGFNNTNGAVGFRVLDTTLMDNGLHTISWAVTDDAGAVEGLGSRFFTVVNGASALTSASPLASSAKNVDIDDAALDTTPLVGRRGWDLEAPYAAFGAGATGVTVIRSEEVNRVELQLGRGDYTGYLRTPAGLAPLPIGSHLDRTTNTFTWAPGVGFVGPYNFVFVRSLVGRVDSRREVRIVLHPKGRGAVGPQVVIDVPRPNTTVTSPFLIGGWAVDLDAPEGTGVTTLHAWAFPASGGAPIFLGATAYGGTRPDVAAIHGDRFKGSGFGLIGQGLPAGDYDLALFAWSTETMGFVAPKVVRLSIRP